ncbi:RNA polymerase sigma70 [Fervidicella metallireducens AeB]|uniref:RNA polymerase sigma70 n=2 Tax=Fervidicella TaxID=1403538 RepID=A0A017RTW6_9CLOT|nr:RNA polymerase sporulation sigma factor SigF [Fervidicella metallireducens]EYE88092.1 RNA polymerase sigma70 [Fervidicella metallireducens AeB]
MMDNAPNGSNILEHDEVIELINRIKQGDKEAQDILVQRNIGLVSAIVKKFLNRGYEYDDLYQIGCIGLIKAVKNFDPNFNVRFSTYAVPMIIGEIKRFLRDDGPVKVSRNIKEIAKKVKIVKERLTNEYGREVSVKEIADELCITSEDVIMSLESMSAPEYLYDTIHQDDGSPVLLIDKISEDRDYGSDVIDKVALKELINRLEPKARQVIMLRYFNDLTQSQIAEKLGISQVQVSRIEKKVIKFMRSNMI